MKLELEPDNSGRLVLAGDLTIQHVADMRAVLLEALQKVQQLIVDMSKVTDIDVSCLQLLCSAHRTYIKSGKAIAFKDTRPAAVNRVMEAAGYSPHVCGAGEAMSCLWKGEKG